MKVAGIITEYNPFHNGHLYHIQKTKEITGADYLIAVMSGDFTQRGLPAFADKYLRAQTALLNGVDLVIELPVVYACHSAEFFSLGAVSILSSLSVVTDICFGSECGSMETLTSIAEFFSHPPKQFHTQISELVKDGITYPQARAIAASRHFPENADIGSALKSPNNILGIEYLKALHSLQSTIIPHTILREGSGYHEKKLHSSFSSAYAIRSALQNGNTLSSLKKQMPSNAYSLLQDYDISYGSIIPNDLSSVLYYKLLSELPNGYSSYLDVSKDLSSRIQKNLNNYTTFSEFAELLKTKELTHTRINRCLLHILLNITQEKVSYFIDSGISHYARILALNTNAKPLFSQLKKHSQIPLISKLSTAHKNLDETGMEMLSYDIFASTLYHFILSQKYNQPNISEYRKSPIK